MRVSKVGVWRLSHAAEESRAIRLARFLGGTSWLCRAAAAVVTRFWRSVSSKSSFLATWASLWRPPSDFSHFMAIAHDSRIVAVAQMLGNATAIALRDSQLVGAIQNLQAGADTALRCRLAGWILLVAASVRATASPRSLLANVAATTAWAGFLIVGACLFLASDAIVAAWADWRRSRSGGLVQSAR